MFTIILIFLVLGMASSGIGQYFLAPRQTQWTSVCFLVAATLLAVVQIFIFEPSVTVLARWLESGSFSADWALMTDKLSVGITAFSLVLGTILAFASLRDVETHGPKLTALICAMCMGLLFLVASENLAQLFLGAALILGVRYLLLGLDCRSSSTMRAAQKSIVIQAIGLIPLALGLGAAFQLSDSLNFAEVLDPNLLTLVAEQQFRFLSINMNAMELVGCLIVLGALGLSGVFPFQNWAQNQKAPPSHALIVVNGLSLGVGVIVLVRLTPLWSGSSWALGMLVLFGAITALFAAIQSLLEKDILRPATQFSLALIALVFVALGIGGASVGILFLAGLFAVISLFLLEGVRNGAEPKADLMQIGGLRDKLPLHFGLFLSAGLMLFGFGLPIASGSLGNIGAAVWLLILSILGVSWTRIVSLIFFGETKLKKKHLEAITDGAWRDWAPIAASSALGFFVLILTLTNTLPANATFWISAVPLLLGIGIGSYFLLRRPQQTEILVEKADAIAATLAEQRDRLFDKLHGFLASLGEQLGKIADWAEGKFVERPMAVILAKFSADPDVLINRKRIYSAALLGSLILIGLAWAFIRGAS